MNFDINIAHTLIIILTAIISFVFGYFIKVSNHIAIKFDLNTKMWIAIHGTKMFKTPNGEQGITWIRNEMRLEQFNFTHGYTLDYIKNTSDISNNIAYCHYCQTERELFDGFCKHCNWHINTNFKETETWR